MRITESQLRRIIRQEVQALVEARRKAQPSAAPAPEPEPTWSAAGQRIGVLDRSMGTLSDVIGDLYKQEDDYRVEHDLGPVDEKHATWVNAALKAAKAGSASRTPSTRPVALFVKSLVAQGVPVLGGRNVAEMKDAWIVKSLDGTAIVVEFNDESSEEIYLGDLFDMIDSI